MAEVYVWGDGSQVASFDAHSIAIAHYLSLYYPEIKIIPNSNVFGSYNGRLPMLITANGQQIHGYKRIVDYTRKNFTGNGTLKEPKDVEMNLIYNGFMESTLETFEIITAYNLFLNKDNYISYTRPLFKILLPFPLQYGAPLKFKQDASDLCENYGITADDSFKEENSHDIEMIKAKENELSSTPILNNVQKLQVEKSLNELAIKKSALTNMRCIELLDETVSQYKQLKIESFSAPGILFLSYLEVNTNSALECTFVKNYLEQSSPSLLQQLDSFSKVGDKFQIQQKPISLVSALCTAIGTL